MTQAPRPLTLRASVKACHEGVQQLWSTALGYLAYLRESSSHWEMTTSASCSWWVGEIDTKPPPAPPLAHSHSHVSRHLSHPPAGA